MWEALQILNSLYALTLVGTLLSMLTLRIVTGSSNLQINLIGEYRTAAERATRCCQTNANQSPLPQPRPDVRPREGRAIR